MVIFINMPMRVLSLSEPGSLIPGTRPDPVPLHGEAVLRIIRGGVCGTDLHAYQGLQPFFQYPRIPGHELCGVLTEPMDGSLAGDLFTIIPYIHCGTCGACVSGRTNCCRRLSVMGVHCDGGWAEFLRVRSDLLLPGDGLSADALAVVEPFAIGAHALVRAAPLHSECVVVIGAGPIGHGIIRQLLAMGIEPIVLETSRVRRQLAEGIPGIKILDPQAAAFKALFDDLTSGEGADLIIEASGSLGAIQSMAGLLSHGGRMVLVGLQQEAFHFSHPEFHKREATLMSSRNATKADFLHVMELMRSGKLNPEMLVSLHVPSADVPGQFPLWAVPDSPVLKAMIHFDQPT